ncbi:MBL fold metallo-hydrolase [Alloacidobacterium dinghuense]|uniref:MBL fold metallo-hydrolase n=1 Tax=Alloacidobacterium dinghuense TaxID=2763107 RepID=A0A7G8BFH0_9BACT|nr:MBL fold metallo-hydrolase [Alloacidobacterium dinghuense]QNI31290.1 MBL fold metallo-hydrolase [Alloacidobacterium dinghuense]
MSHPAERADSHELIRGRTTLGDFELTVLSDGFYFLDGGAMFGVVPKPLWEKRAPTDDQNRILLGLNTVVVRTGKQTVVIETGIGNKLSDKLREIYGAKQNLLRAFAAAGIKPEEVDIVINSHLHFDHCGWNTTRTSDGRVVPTFPNARYFAHRGEVEHGHLQLERDAISYISENYDPLVESRQMTLLDVKRGETREIVPGISVEGFPGHTSQLMAVHLESGGKRACYISDLIPTSAHLDITWVMGYDLDPLTCIEERKRFYARAIPEEWLVLFTHDHHTPFGYVALNDKGKPVIQPPR